MKTEALKALGLTDEQIAEIMKENGKDIETTKAKLADHDTIKEQLAEANKAIEGFKAMDMNGLGDYSRNDGYVKGDVTLTNETVKCNFYRGRMFTVDTMDNIETAGIAFGQLSGEFIRTKVVPEEDAFRFASYAGEEAGGFAKAPCSSISPGGLVEISRTEDIWGGATVENQLNFALYAVLEKPAADTECATYNADWLMDFQMWVQGQSIRQLVPHFGNTDEQEVITAQHGTIFETGNEGVSIYLVQLSVV